MKGNKSKKALIVLIAIIMVFVFGIQCFATEVTEEETGTQTTGNKVTIEKKVEGTKGSVTFILTGVDFEAGKNYEYTVSKTDGVPENAIFTDVSMDYSKKQIEVTITENSYYTEDREILIQKVNTAYLFVREKGTEKYILEKEELNLKLPFKNAVDIDICKESNNDKYIGGIKINVNDDKTIFTYRVLYDYQLSDTNYVFQKITNSTLIERYQTSKDSNEILDKLEDSDIPKDGWKQIDSNNQYSDATIYKTSFPTEKGLYVLWLKLQRSGDKVVYAAPYVYDNLGADHESGETVIELTAEVSYNPTETTTGTVIATIKTNKKVNKIDGWTISEDGKTLTKTYSKNITETLTLVDEDGKKKNVEVKVSNITTKQVEDEGKEDGKDETVTPSKKIPQTGESYVIFAVTGVVVLAGIIGIIRYRKYKGI